MRRFFDHIELTPDEEEAMTIAAEANPLVDDPELEAAVQEARKRLAADERNADKKKRPPHLPAGGQ